MYEQTLWSEVKNVVNPKILSKNNRLKKWEYGYNKDYDFIVISKTGKIGKIIEIQNLRIALPAEHEPFKRSEDKSGQYWEQFEYPKELKKIKSRFDWEKYPMDFREEWWDYIDEEFKRRDEGFWFYNNVLITCTCNGQRLISEHQTIEKQTDYSLYFGKPVKQMHERMECVTLKSVPQNWLTKQQYPVIQDMEYYPNQVLMPKKCLPIKLYPSQLIIRSSSNPSKMVWIVLKPNLPIEYQHCTHLN
jgi:hypothetical protein